MKKLALILAGLLIAAGSVFAQPVPIEKTLTLTTGFTATDSVRIPQGYVPVSVRTLDITNATSFVPQLCFDRTPTDWYDVLELGAATDYTVSIADTSITAFDPRNIYLALGKGSGREGVTTEDSDAYYWFRLAHITAEAADKTFVVKFRYL